MLCLKAIARRYEGAHKGKHVSLPVGPFETKQVTATTWAVVLPKHGSVATCPAEDIAELVMRSLNDWLLGPCSEDIAHSICQCGSCTPGPGRGIAGL